MADTNPYSWPIGWMVSYLGSDGCRTVDTGVIAGPAELSAECGRVIIPVRSADTPADTITRWVREAEIIALAPVAVRAPDAGSPPDHPGR